MSSLGLGLIMVSLLSFNVLVVLLLLYMTPLLAVRYDCCLPKLSSTGIGCETDTTVGNTTYYCVQVADSCSYCQLAVNETSTSCYQCCATSEDYCGLPFSYITTSSWTLICIIFAGSCCCCSIVFLSAEHSRIKEGITFREAYLLPIPLVTVELDVDTNNKDLFPIDQPTAIARAHTSIDIPIAEPTEVSSLMTYREQAGWD